MRRMLVVFGALVLAMACDSITGWDGPIVFGIHTGNRQAYVAGGGQFVEPVVGRAVRAEGAKVTGLLTRALNAEVVGTGVPDIDTCSRPVGDYGLVAPVTCRRTDGDGYVEYWYERGTVAGQHCAEIWGGRDGEEPRVLAKTCATIEPGIVAVQENGWVASSDIWDPRAPLDTLYWYASDRFGNITEKAWFEIPDYPKLVTVDALLGAGIVPADTADLPQVGDTFRVNVYAPDSTLISAGTAAVNEANIWDSQTDSTYYGWAVAVRDH